MIVRAIFVVWFGGALLVWVGIVAMIAGMIIRTL